MFIHKIHAHIFYLVIAIIIALVAIVGSAYLSNQVDTAIAQGTFESEGCTAGFRGTTEEHQPETCITGTCRLSDVYTTKSGTCTQVDVAEILHGCLRVGNTWTERVYLYRHGCTLEDVDISRYKYCSTLAPETKTQNCIASSDAVKLYGWVAYDGLTSLSQEAFTVADICVTEIDNWPQCRTSTDSTTGLQSCPTVTAISSSPVICYDGTTDTSVTKYPPNVNLTANPSTIVTGGTSALSWTVTGTKAATSCTASGAWSGSKATGGGSENVSPPATSTYTITCSNADGSDSDTETITVTSAPVVKTADIKANNSDGPIAVAYDTPVEISWSSANASSCSVSTSGDGNGPWNGLSGLSDSGNLTTENIYTINCDSGGATDSVTIQVEPAPEEPEEIEVTLTANPVSIDPGNSSTLTWTVTGDPDSCTATNGWGGSKNIGGGNESVSPNTPTLYSLTCSDSSGIQGSDDATVFVNEPENPVDVNVSSNKNENDCYDAEWSVNVPDPMICVPSSSPQSFEWNTTVTAQLAAGATSGEVELCELVTATTITLTCGAYSDSATITLPFIREINPGGEGETSFNFLDFLRGLFPGFVKSSYAGN